MKSPWKVLVLSRSYPNSVMELLGLWVERLVRHSASFCEPKVIAPVPYCPPLPGLPEEFGRFRRVERCALRQGVEVFYPRLLTGPGYSLYSFESTLYRACIQRLVTRLRRRFRFDLIHAHFTYPDGVVAAALGRRYGVPVVITEHVPWDVWNSFPRVLERVALAARAAARHISVSESVLRSVQRRVGRQPNLAVIPNGVDGAIFAAAPPDHKRRANQILFAGAVRPVKGVDVLLRAMRILVDRGRDVTLTIAGDAFYRPYRKEEHRLRRMTRDLGLGGCVLFAGKRSPAELASSMWEAAMLVLPSRAESFGSVLVEALACGTPVVATRCGGPEEIVTPEVGVLVPPEDPETLAGGMERVLDNAGAYEPSTLRAYALERFSLESVGNRLAEIYRSVLPTSRPV